MDPTKGLVFDADDTLWETEPLYDRSLTECQRYVEPLGLDPTEWRDTQRKIDVQNVAVLGFSIERFPTSSAQAYDAITGTKDTAESKQVYEISKSVFAAAADIMEDAQQVLTTLKDRGHPLYLMTKGDLKVQQKRLADASFLTELFDHVRIVDSKGPADFKTAAQALNRAPSQCVSIGNSLRSDIEPAVQAGLSAVWIEAYVWDYEKVDRNPDHGGITLPPGTVELKSLSELPSYLRA